MCVMNTTKPNPNPNPNLNPEAPFNPLAGARSLRSRRPLPRWLIFLTSGFALLILAKIALVAGQIFAILNATYSASLT